MSDDEEEQGGRIFFSNIGRSMELEDEIVLTSVGIDIGSSTSHLAFSRIVLERLDTRYMVVERTLLHQSDVLLTSYRGDDEIDAVFTKCRNLLVGRRALFRAHADDSNLLRFG